MLCVLPTLGLQVEEGRPDVLKIEGAPLLEQG